MTGPLVSTTVTVSLQVFEFPHGSVALQKRVAVKTMGQVTDRLVVVRKLVMTTPLVPTQASKALGVVKVQVVPHCTDRLRAESIRGAFVSTTVTVWLHTFELPQASRALQNRVAVKTVGQVTVGLVVVRKLVITT